MRSPAWKASVCMAVALCSSSPRRCCRRAMSARRRPVSRAATSCRCASVSTSLRRAASRACVWLISSRTLSRCSASTRVCSLFSSTWICAPSSSVSRACMHKKQSRVMCGSGGREAAAGAAACRRSWRRRGGPCSASHPDIMVQRPVAVVCELGEEAALGALVGRRQRRRRELRGI